MRRNKYPEWSFNRMGACAAKLPSELGQTSIDAQFDACYV
jgi:hypothetical protein